MYQTSPNTLQYTLLLFHLVTIANHAAIVIRNVYFGVTLTCIGWIPIRILTCFFLSSSLPWQIRKAVLHGSAVSTIIWSLVKVHLLRWRHGPSFIVKRKRPWRPSWKLPISQGVSPMSWDLVSCLCSRWLVMNRTFVTCLNHETRWSHA